MLTDDDTRLACPDHYYRISLFTRDRLAESERTGDGNAYLLAVAQAMRELDEPRVPVPAGPMQRWIVDEQGRVW